MKGGKYDQARVCASVARSVGVCGGGRSGAGGHSSSTARVDPRGVGRWHGALARGNNLTTACGGARQARPRLCAKKRVQPSEARARCHS
jgi:hypothetical protein